VNETADKISEVTRSRFVICVDNEEYPASLERHKIYRLLPDEEAEQEGDVRIVDESGENYLYPADYFLPVDLPRSTAPVLNRAYCERSNPLLGVKWPLGVS
jgi:hypothetical protein